MKKFKVFIASSEELKLERLELIDCKVHMQKEFRKQGFEIELVIWESLDASMGEQHKQDDYNEKLKECDLFIGLFSSRFGEYTKKECEVAFAGMQNGENPKRMHFFFKENSAPSPELVEFKNSIKADNSNLISEFANSKELRDGFLDFLNEFSASDISKIKDNNSSSRNKILKVFFATADELKIEKLEFSALIDQLNGLFKHRGLEIEPVVHDSENYHSQLDECELCLTIYWNQFGKYSKEEFEQAYTELTTKEKNPNKIYVFFKDPTNITDDLKGFKDSFATDYGHFFCKFENVDTLRLQFLLQLEGYNASSGQEFLKVENQKVKIDGQELADLSNVPFASGNEDFNRMREELENLEGQIAKYRRILSKMKDEDIEDLLEIALSKRLKLKEEFEKHQDFLLNLALQVAKASTRRLSDRSKKAIDLFNSGKATEANAILDTEDLTSDTEQTIKELKIAYEQIGEATQKINTLFDDWLLKTSTALADTTKPIEARVEEAKNAFEFAKKCAVGMKMQEEEKARYLSFLFDYGTFLQKYSKYEEAKRIFQEELPLCESVYGLLHPFTAQSYDKLGTLYRVISKFGLSVEYHEKARTILEKIHGAKSVECINVYSNLAALYMRIHDYKKSLDYALSGLEISERHYGLLHSDTATAYGNVSWAYCCLGEYEKSHESGEKALELKKKLYGEEHIDIILSYYDLGQLYLAERNFPSALDFLNKALALGSKLVGEEHSRSALYLRSLSELYSLQGDYDKAFECMNKAVMLYHKNFVDDHLELGYCYSALASYYFDLENYEMAIEYYTKALAIYEKFIDFKSDFILTTLNEIALCNEKLGGNR